MGCGDFNSTLANDSPLCDLLVQSGLKRADCKERTFIVQGYRSVLDHIWSDMVLTPGGTLCCSSVSHTLPDVEHPSDHLPVVAKVEVATFDESILEPLKALPQAMEALVPSEAVCYEWTQILRSRDPRAGHPGSRGKVAAREQRKLE